MKNEAIRAFDNLNRESPIQALTVALCGGESGALGAAGDYFLVFKWDEPLEDRKQYEISELDGFLQNEENRLSPTMVEQVRNYHSSQMAKRQQAQGAEAANHRWRSLAGAAMNVANETIKAFDNLNRESPIEGLTVALCGEESGAIGAAGDYFLVFKRDEPLEDREQYDISELDGFLKNKENKLSDKMVEDVQDFYRSQMAKRQEPQGAEAANHGWDRLAGAAMNVASVLFGPGAGERDHPRGEVSTDVSPPVSPARLRHRR